MGRVFESTYLVCSVAKNTSGQDIFDVVDVLEVHPINKKNVKKKKFFFTI